MIDRLTGLSRQIGFVRFETAQQAQTVIDEMNGFRLSPGAPPLIIKFADTKEQKEARQAMRGRARPNHVHGVHHGAPNSHIPPMYYYYQPFAYPQGYPNFGANPAAAAAAAAAAGYNANAYPYAFASLGYGAPYSSTIPEGFSGLSLPPPQPGDEKAEAVAVPTGAAAFPPRTYDRPQVQFTPQAANVPAAHNI